MRAVMEHLAENGPMTVPQIARSKNVTRQHIQPLADELVAAGFAIYEENPGHKRSQLVKLSRMGERTFDTIRKREKTYLDAVAAGFSAEELETVVMVLVRFRHRLAEAMP